MIKRQGYVVRIVPECLERMKNNLCPICGKPKEKWTRRKDWRCCSTDCTQKFEENKIIRSWADVRLRAFKRDNFKCVKCGCQPTILRQYNNNYETFDNFKKYIEESNGKWIFLKEWTGRNAVLFNPEGLIGDHIKPIALGGDEFDINNVQTLCPDCNKIKTKKDMGLIAFAKKHQGVL